MAYDLLKEEVIGLPDDKVMILVEFARFLKQSMNESKKPQKVKRKIGMMKEKFLSISPDFDTCLEGLEDYI